MAGVLADIVDATRREVARRKAQVPMRDLERQALAGTPRADCFIDALSRFGRVNVIAECKRRSPSRGLLCRDYDPAALARRYEQAGAAAVSVLTEPAFFGGSLEHLSQVRAAVDVPLLRKDFIVDDYQLLEARAAGADAVLLIASVLDGDELPRLLDHTRSLGLAALVEVHDADELARALDAGASVVGVNNRNLQTLRVNLETSQRLIARVPGTVVAVAESGVRSREDVARLSGLGYRAFLVGERLMTSADPCAALADLLAARHLPGPEP